MPEDNGTTPKAPYMPYTTFKRFLGSLKAGAIPSRIDKTLMPGQSGSMQSWMMAALRFFDLIDDLGHPKEELDPLVSGNDDERKKIWHDVFTQAYDPIITGLDLQRATPGQLNERFIKDFSAETARKCISFFAAGAEDAGIVLGEHLKPKARSSVSGVRRSRRNRNVPGAGSEDEREVGPSEGKPHSNSATLLLDREGARFVRLQAPPTVTKAELTRIQNWLSFQLIVEEGEDN